MNVVFHRWVEREMRPISLRQLTFFGRTLTEARLISSANYVRTELPSRLAHRLRDIQKLPYVVVSNPHMSLVYELYYQAFERFRTIPEIKTLDDNDRFCDILRKTLKDHLVVIPQLAMGVLECRDLVPREMVDQFMNTLLRAVSLHVTCCRVPCTPLTPTSEDLPSRYCGAASGFDGDFQLAVALLGAF